MAGTLLSTHGSIRRLGWNLRTFIAALVLASFVASPRARAALFEAFDQAFGTTLGRLLRWLAGLGRPRVRKDFLSLGSEAANANGVESGKIAKYLGQSAESKSLPHAATSEASQSTARFSDFGAILPSWLSESLYSGGFDTMKPIQREILPLALAGHDVVGVAPTGSGKTLAFLVPGLVHAAGQPPLRGPADGPIVLVLAPTRELAMQIGSVADGLLRPGWSHAAEAGGSRNGQSGQTFNCAVLYGGARRSDQLQTLRFQHCTQVVVATPGRLLDFLEHRAFGLNRVSFFVLDEGDRMLDFGFEPDVTAIAAKIRKDRQMLFFSATWPTEVEAAASKLCGREHAFKTVFATREGVSSIGGEDSEGKNRVLPGQEGIALPPSGIRQVVEVMQCNNWDYNYDKILERKVPLLLKHLEGAFSGDAPGKALIFVSTRRAAEELGEVVSEYFGLRRCGVMHGARKQEQREATLRAFRSGQIRALVATDVVGRGVDIPQVTHVVIFDFPGDIETYVHRVGRTGRNGQSGTAISFFESQPWCPNMAKELVDVLVACGQHVPNTLAKEAGLLNCNSGDFNSSLSNDDDGDGGEPLWAVDETQAWRTAPPLNSDGGPELATKAELGAWDASGARVWGYSANGGFTEQGRMELRTKGALRTTWGWGEWSLVQAGAPCPPPSRPCPVIPAGVPEASAVPPCPPPSRPCPPMPGSKEAQEAKVQQQPAPHLALSWGGCTDIVALDASGMGFELVSRSGKPAQAYRKKTLGRALAGVSL